VTVLSAGLLRLYDRLVSSGLPYFVVGAVAAISYGEPRTTLDIDLTIQATPADAERIVAAFASAEFYVRREGGQFNVIDLTTATKADIDVAGDDPLIAFGFAHASERELGGHRLRIAPATYVVAMKLRFYGISRQDKHLRDVRSILAVSPEEVDVAEVTRWAERYGVADAWRECREHPGTEDRPASGA
jgi:hypothetical protein